MELTWRLVLAVALLCSQSDGTVPCKNEKGATVDWYILYKLPNGLRAFYMDPLVPAGRMIQDISHQSGALAQTLQPYFHQNGNTGFIVYNDQPPTCSAMDVFGHSKGLLLIPPPSPATNAGLWLLHSTPKFPYSRESNNFYPDSGQAKAQTFICVSFKYMELIKIGKHLQYINAHVFEAFLPPAIYSYFSEAANKLRVAPDPNTAAQLYHDLTSAGGATFRSFFKKILKSGTSQEDEDGDLYHTIADNIGSNVYVQTFKQPYSCESYCPTSGHHVHNVEKVSVSRTEWERGNDHSKWCVSQNNDWTCFADSNRAVTQYKRRGGALCINLATVNAKFKTFIIESEECPEVPRKCPRPSTDQ